MKETSLGKGDSISEVQHERVRGMFGKWLVANK